MNKKKFILDAKNVINLEIKALRKVHDNDNDACTEVQGWGERCVGFALVRYQDEGMGQI